MDFRKSGSGKIEHLGHKQWFANTICSCICTCRNRWETEEIVIHTTRTSIVLSEVPWGRVRTQDEPFFSTRNKHYISQPNLWFTLAKLPFRFDKYEQLKACVAGLCKVKWRNMLISSRCCNLLRVSFWSTTPPKGFYFLWIRQQATTPLNSPEKERVWKLQCSPFHAIKISNCTGGERIKLMIGQFNCKRYSQILFQRNRVAVLLLLLLLPIN